MSNKSPGNLNAGTTEGISKSTFFTKRSQEEAQGKSDSKASDSPVSSIKVGISERAKKFIAEENQARQEHEKYSDLISKEIGVSEPLFSSKRVSSLTSADPTDTLLRKVRMLSFLLISITVFSVSIFGALTLIPDLVQEISSSLDSLDSTEIEVSNSGEDTGDLSSNEEDIEDEDD